MEQACRLSLKDLKLDYLDLYLIHWPVSVNYVPFEDQYPPQPTIDTRSKGKIIRVPLHETWSVMEQLVDKGLARHIGVSNFEIQLLQDLESYARIPPVVNQVKRKNRHSAVCGTILRLLKNRVEEHLIV